MRLVQGILITLVILLALGPPGTDDVSFLLLVFISAVGYYVWLSGRKEE